MGLDEKWFLMNFNEHLNVRNVIGITLKLRKYKILPDIEWSWNSWRGTTFIFIYLSISCWRCGQQLYAFHLVSCYFVAPKTFREFPRTFSLHLLPCRRSSIYCDMAWAKHKDRIPRQLMPEAIFHVKGSEIKGPWLSLDKHVKLE